jgi:hypothetical protein
MMMMMIIIIIIIIHMLSKLTQETALLTWFREVADSSLGQAIEQYTTKSR